MPRASVEGERRRALLKAAFREVAERGFSQVTLEDIAVRAGVSKGVTLYYFDSKEDLFRELFAWLIDSIHARMRDAVEAVDDPVEKVKALVALIFPSPSRNRAFFRAYVDFCGLAARKEPFRQIGQRFYAGCRDIDQAIVEEGMRRGAFVLRDAGETASTLRAIFDGLMLQWLAEPDLEACFETYRQRCERELLHYLRLPGAPAPERKSGARPARTRPKGVRGGREGTVESPRR